MAQTNHDEIADHLASVNDAGYLKVIKASIDNRSDDLGTHGKNIDASQPGKPIVLPNPAPATGMAGPVKNPMAPVPVPGLGPVGGPVVTPVSPAKK